MANTHPQTIKLSSKLKFGIENYNLVRREAYLGYTKHETSAREDLVSDI